MDMIQRLEQLEKTVERHSERLTAIEKRTAEDHETLKAVKRDVEGMKADMTDMKKDVGLIKQQNTVTAQSIDKMCRWLKVVGAMAVVAFAYVVIRNEQTASAVTSLVATIGKLFI